MKGKAITEILLLFALFAATGYATGATGLVRWKRNVLGWSYTGGLCLILIPVIILLVTGRDSGVYGLTLRRWRYDLDVGLTSYLVLLIPLGLRRTSGPPSRPMTTRLYIAVDSSACPSAPANISVAVFGCVMRRLLSARPTKIMASNRHDLAVWDA